MSAQLALYEPLSTPKVPPIEPERRQSDRRQPAPEPVLCASCHAHEARYGFRASQDDPLVGRPRTLCFECFRLEMSRRQEAARAVQPPLPLDQRLDHLRRRRGRAQIAARRALGLR